MVELGFEPLTTALGISGTSYLLQLGLINGKWAGRILKGKNIIDSYVFKDEDVEGDRPNSNIIVGWVLRTVTLPNINPYGIMKTVQALLKQALDKKDKMRMSAPVSETKHIKLDKVPESELKRPATQGTVIDKPKTEEEKRQAFQQRVLFSREQEPPFTEPAPPATKTSRTLPSIPSGSDQETVPFIPSSGPAGAKKGEKDKGSRFCPYCGGNLNWIYCPYCGKKLPH
ncbi:MAG: zinc ribbon domain-containing protein [Promethearchaeota archaeon]